MEEATGQRGHGASANGAPATKHRRDNGSAGTPSVVEAAAEGKAAEDSDGGGGDDDDDRNDSAGGASARDKGAEAEAEAETCTKRRRRLRPIHSSSHGAAATPTPSSPVSACTAPADTGSAATVSEAAPADANVSAPLLELFNFHKAIRRELLQLSERLCELDAREARSSCSPPPSPPPPPPQQQQQQREDEQQGFDAAAVETSASAWHAAVASGGEQYAEALARLRQLRRMLEHHCSSEDDVLIPALVGRGFWDASNPCAQCHHSEEYGELTRTLASVEASLEAAATQGPRRRRRRATDGDEARFSSAFDRLRSLIEMHLLEEEEAMAPVFHDSMHLSPDEQGELLAKVVFSMPRESQSPLILRALRALALQDRGKFLRTLSRYAAAADFSRIAGDVAHGLPSEDFACLTVIVPGLRAAAAEHLHPLIEIKHIHQAMRASLDELQQLAAELDPLDDMQLRALANRVEFLRRVHEVHSYGEDDVFLRELVAREPALSDALHDDHDHEERVFQRLLALVGDIRGTADVDERQRLMELCRARARSLAGHLTLHMANEESRLLPLLEKHFSVDAQDRLVREVMRRVPDDMLSALIPWVLAALPIEEREKMMRNLLRSMPRDEFNRLACSLVDSVQKGVLGSGEWQELVRRMPGIPELEIERAQDSGFFADSLHAGPIAEVMRVHKAIRVELQELADKAVALDADALNPRRVAALSERLGFLKRMVQGHSEAEDYIVLPALAERVSGVVEEYEDDHDCEKHLFDRLDDAMRSLQCAGTAAETRALVVKVRGLARALCVDLMSHLDREERSLWPLLAKHFDEGEQSRIVAQVFGRMPAERLRELIPWMVRVLSRHEQQDMMNHILRITRSTMFEKWLRTWFPQLEDIVGGGAGGGKEADEAQRQPVQHDKERLRNAAERYIDKAKGDVERAVRTIARDETIGEREKSLLMQNLMLLSWEHASSSTSSAAATSAPSSETGVRPSPASQHLSAEALRPTHRPCSAPSSSSSSSSPSPSSSPPPVLGCRHYARACKLLAPCCNRYYTCRLCHDESGDHIMDRYAVRRILCMRCSTEQPPADACAHCRARFARYACLVCKLFDDDASRSIYHCHSCNVCRVGRGLGIDFFHCMKCNACMSIKYVQNHQCIERSMESDCPVCSEFLFTSTTPVKFLKCGHLMHAACFRTYAKSDFRCPVCQKSLADMSAYFDTLLAREPMPREYRGVMAEVACNDCAARSTAEFHFLYNRCRACGSFNTRVVRVIGEQRSQRSQRGSAAGHGVDEAPPRG